MNTQLINKFRKKLKKGIPVISSWSQISDQNLLELLVNKKFDCSTLDFEHGIFSIENFTDMTEALAGNDDFDNEAAPECTQQ